MFGLELVLHLVNDHCRWLRSTEIGSHGHATLAQVSDPSSQLGDKRVILRTVNSLS